MSIPTTIHDLAKPRPTTHGEVMPQEIRVGQMLLAQTILALIARIDRLLVRDADEEPAPKPAKAPRVLKAPDRRIRESAIEAPVAPPVAPPVDLADVPDDVPKTAKAAYVEGREARRGGQGEDLNPFTGDRGIPGARRCAWLRGHRDGGA